RGVNNTVSGFGKNGVTCNDLGLTCEVSGNTVTATPMPSGFAATNGIQFYDAAGSIEANTVDGNVYLPGSCLDQNYFTPSSGCPSPYWSGGILIITPPTPVDVSSNVLSDNQVGIWSLGAPTIANDNTVTTWGYYGIVLDFNFADAYGTANVLAPAPYSGSAEDNLITDQNVGILAYDDNATITGNQLSSVNVSIEVATDTPVASVDDVSFNVGSSNVSGALLGNISSFQADDVSTPTGNFTVNANTFTNVSAASAGSQGSGIAINGATATLSNNAVTGFPSGISAVVSPAGNVSATGNVVTAPTPAIPGAGLYVFAGNASLDGNSISGYSWMNGPGWWPNSQATGLFV